MNRIVTISRQFGSGGNEIGRLLARRFAVPFYDNAIIEEAARNGGGAARYLKDPESGSAAGFRYSMARGPEYAKSAWPLEDALFNAQSDVIRRAAQDGACVIIGRCSDYILGERDDICTVFIHAELAFRIARVMASEGVTRDKAEAMIKLIDKRRAHYHDHHSPRKWGEAANYDICLNSAFCGINGAVELLSRFVQA